MRKGLVVAGIVLAAALGGGYWLHLRAEQAVDAGIERVRSGLPQGSQLEIGARDVGLLARGAVLRDVSLTLTGANPVKVTIGRLSVGGAVPRFDGGVRFGEVALDDLAIQPSGANIDEVRIAHVTGADLFYPPGAFDAAQIEIGRLVIDHASTGGGEGVVTLDKAEVTGLKSGLLDRLTLAGLRIDTHSTAAPAAQLTAGNLSARRVPLAKLLAALRQGNSAASGIGELHLADLSLTLPNGQLSLGRLDFIEAPHDDGAWSAKQTLDADGIQFRPGKDVAQLAAVLAKLGRETIGISLHTESSGDNAAPGVTVQQSLTLDGMGELTGEAVLEGAALRGGTTQESMAQFLNLSLSKLRLTWLDHGLTPALETMGGNSAASIAMVGSALTSGFLKGLNLGAAAEDWPAQIGAFLTSPGRLMIELNPAAPVAIHDLTDPTLTPAAKIGLLHPTIMAGPLP